jgi:threonine dehydratase
MGDNKTLFEKIKKASTNLEGVVKKTPLQYISRLSRLFDAEIYFKREDLQEVRSFKIRGAYNKISQLSEKEKEKGVVTASAGNHAQGVALSCYLKKIKGTIFMPKITPRQKIERVVYFGNDWIDVKLEGENYDETAHAAKEFSQQTKAIYIHAFDDEEVIAGQGTIGKEIWEGLKKVDYVIVSIGGGGLIGGIATYLKEKDKKINVIGVESEGTASMSLSLERKKIMSLDELDTFCDGVAVKTPGELTFRLCSTYVNKIIVVPEGKVSLTMINLFQNEGIITEPAGALSIAALDELKDEIKGKKVVCIISGGNFDLLRYPEVLEKSLIYQGRKHYFIVEFAQRPGELRSFVNEVLGKNDDIVLFEYLKKNNKEKGPILIGIEYPTKEDYEKMKERIIKNNFSFREIFPNENFFHLLVY